MTTEEDPTKHPPMVIVGSASAGLTAPLAAALEWPMSEPLVERFPDGELHVELRDPVRCRTVFLVQTTGAPVGEALMELLLLADACRRGGARATVAVLPYMGYARQDRRGRETEALGIRVFAGVLAQGGFARIIAVDVHAPASEGCFAVPLDHVSAIPLLADVLARDLPPRPVIVAPDVGALRMARAYAQRLGAPFAVVHKQRRGAEVTVGEVSGEVAGRTPIVIDDILATGTTIAEAIAAVRARGASGPALVVISHLVPHTGAAARLASAPIDRVVTTDSLPDDAAPWPVPVTRVSLAPLLADVIGRVHYGGSIADLMVTR